MKPYADQSHVKVPPFTEQTRWNAGLFDFGGFGTGRRIFNPAIMQHLGDDWLIARVSEEVPGNPFGKNELYSFKLDGKHKPQYGIKINFRGYRNQHWEDPRVMRREDGSVLLSYTTFVLETLPGNPPHNRWFGAHQGISYLDRDFQPISSFDPIYGNNGGSVMQNQPDEEGLPKNEKNWLWFEYEGRLHTIYMTEPHQVVTWQDDWQNVEDIYCSEGPSEDRWKYGQPRGGTSPIRIGDEYWSFFHSSTTWKEWTTAHKRRYHMGAYAFDAKPPFRITKFSRFPLLTGSPKDPWKPGQPLVVFPCGAIYRDGKWTVSLGLNDMASGWIEIPHGDLLETVEPYATTKEASQSPATSEIHVSVPDCGESSFIARVEAEPGIGELGGQNALGSERADSPSSPSGQQPKPGKPRSRRIRRRHRKGLRSGTGLPRRAEDASVASGAVA